MIPRAWVSSITFSDDTEVALDQSDIVVVVGPNNAGKSAALRAIRDKVNNSAVPSPVVTTLRVSRSGSSEEVLSWLESFAKRAEGSPENPIYQTVGIGVHRSHVMSEWSARRTSWLRGSG
jgi:ABC-type cobalamin/Fe3+-siderophores transport system ATPase subunit